MLKKVESLMKKNIWITVIGVAVLAAGGISALVSRTKDYANKATTIVGGAQ